MFFVKTARLLSNPLFLHAQAQSKSINMTDRIKIDVTKAGTFTGHRDCLYTIEASDKANGFFTSGGDGMVVAWDLMQPDQGKLVAKVTNTVYALCHLKDRKQLVVGENTAGVHLIDLNTQEEIRSAQLTSDAVFDIKHKNGKLLIALGDGDLAILDDQELSTIHRIKASDASARCIAVHPHKNEFVVGYSDHSFRVFHADTFKLLYEEQGHTNSIFTLSFSPDGKYLLSGSRDAHLKIWDASAGYELYEPIVAHMFTINHIAFRADGRYFATCSKDKSVKVWDAKQFKLLKVIDKARYAGHGTSVNKLLWIGEDSLVSVSDDRSISVWQMTFHVPESMK